MKVIVADESTLTEAIARAEAEKPKKEASRKLKVIILVFLKWIFSGRVASVSTVVVDTVPVLLLMREDDEGTRKVLQMLIFES